MAAQYLAGFLFLQWVHSDPKTATPLTVARYGYYFGERSDIRRKLWLSSGAGLALVMLPVILALRPRARPLHGSARFSTRGEARQAGLFSPVGIILARVGRRLLRLPGQQGVAVIARSRSGKGAGIVIPNLFEWPDSLICVDPKHENYTITAGHRARSGHAVYLFAPFSETRNTARWNPLGYIPDDPALRINGLQRIADMLYRRRRASIRSGPPRRVRCSSASGSMCSRRRDCLERSARSCGRAWPRTMRGSVRTGSG